MDDTKYIAHQNDGRSPHHYYKQIIPTTTKQIKDNMSQYAQKDVGVELAGICYDIQQQHGYMSAMLDEETCKFELRIPSHVKMTQIINSEHDEMVQLIGNVKVEKNMITKHDGIVKKYCKQWIQVDRIKVLKSISEITHHYLNVMYSKEYLDNYNTILDGMRKSVVQKSTNNTDNEL